MTHRHPLVSAVTVLRNYVEAFRTEPTSERAEELAAQVEAWFGVIAEVAEPLTVPTYADWRAVDCDERLRRVRGMETSTRRVFLAQLEWDDTEFLAESAFLSRDTVYRDQVIARLEELGQFPRAISGYQRAAADQDARRGHWATH